MNALEYVLNKYHIPGAGKMVGRQIEIPDMDRRDLAILFSELGAQSGVEIGVERAVYTKMLARKNPNARIYGVDPWLAYSGYREHVSQEKLDGFCEESKKRMEEFKNVTLMRMTSHAASKVFDKEVLDFVYIDGNHEFRHVVNDISDWMPALKRGGIMAGHDWIERRNPEYLMGVVPAVTGYVHAYRIEPLFIVGSKEKIEGQKRDDQRSWFFIKP